MTTTVAIVESNDLAYEHAFDRHWSDVFRFALAWTNDWGAAEDLAQDAFLRLWDQRNRLDWERPVLPWLETAHQALAGHVAALPDDAELDAPRLTNWGERRPTRWIVAAMITHDAYHAGEINHLRSLMGPDDRWRFEQLGFG